MRSPITFMAAIALCAAAGCTTTPATGGGKWSGVVHPSVLAKAGLQYYWDCTIPLSAGEWVVRLSRLDENVYCITNLNRVIVVDAVSGGLKWAATLAAPRDTVFGPIHADGVTLTEAMSGVGEILTPSRLTNAMTFDAVMFNTMNYVAVYNRATGQAMRRPGMIDFSAQGPRKFIANTRGATDGVLFYVGSPTGEYEAIRLQEGVLVWTMSTTSRLEPITAPLVCFAGRVYATNEGGGIFCATSLGVKGRQEWSQKLDGPIRGGIYVDQRGCFVPCVDHRIYAFDAMTGARLWEPFICQGQLSQAIQVGESSIFQAADQDKLYVLDVATGRLRWTSKTGQLVLAIAGGNVYLKDGTGNLQVLDEMMGPNKPSVAVALTGHELFTGNTTAPAIYTAKSDGRVFCITPADLGKLTVDMLQEPGKLRPKRAAAPTTTSAPAAPKALAP
ncbi:MAG: PQQ-binding-like beta-propeller repeat protein [Phycisphaerae bacterium]